MASERESAAARWAREATPADVEALLLDRARMQARSAVFAQAMAWMARKGHQAQAQRFMAAADERSMGVRMEDLQHVHLNTTPTQEDSDGE